MQLWSRDGKCSRSLCSICVFGGTKGARLHTDGLTWGAKTVLSYPPQQNLGALIGPSVGLQAADGTLYFSASQVGGPGHFLYCACSSLLPCRCVLC